MGHFATGNACSSAPLSSSWPSQVVEARPAARRPGSCSPSATKSSAPSSAAVERTRNNESMGSSEKAARAATIEQADANEKELGKEAIAVSAGEHFIVGLGHVLARWVEHTSSKNDPKATHFHSVRRPAMSIKDYLRRIHKYFMCSDESYVLALVFIDRIGNTDPSLTVCDLNVHRLLFIAVMVAVKFHDDVYYSNAYYSKVGGLSLKEVNALEAKFITLLDWHLFVGPEEYQLYHNLVCDATCPEEEGPWEPSQKSKDSKPRPKGYE